MWIKWFAHAVIHGRQILNASLIANECIVYNLRTNQLGVICKLDIEKAYDHVSWDFLLATLEKMGFPRKWRSWIFFCICSVHFPPNFD